MESIYMSFYNWQRGLGPLQKTLDFEKWSTKEKRGEKSKGTKKCENKMNFWCLDLDLLIASCLEENLVNLMGLSQGNVPSGIKPKAT